MSVSKDFADYLNKLIELDSIGVHNIIAIRVFVSSEIDKDETILLREETNGFSLSPLGLINSFLTKYDSVEGRDNPLIASYDDYGRLLKFTVRNN